MYICTFDDFLQTKNVNLSEVNLIWMDVQGSEGLILSPSKLIRDSNCPIFIEFWPYGMQKLNSYELLRDFILKEVKTMVRFSGKDIFEYMPEEIDDIYNEFNTDGYNACDLLLLR